MRALFGFIPYNLSLERYAYPMAVERIYPPMGVRSTVTKNLSQPAIPTPTRAIFIDRPSPMPSFPQQIHHFILAQGSADMVALRQITVVDAQEVELLFGLHAFGDDFEAEFFA